MGQFRHKIPRAKPEGYISELSSVLLVNTYGVVWLTCTTAGIQIIIVLFAFTVFSFLQNHELLPSNFWQWILHTLGCSPANKPSITSCFSHLERSVEQVLAADPSACTAGTGRLLITTSMNNLKKSHQCQDHSQVINWIAHGQVQWVGNRLNKFHWALQHRYLPMF